MARVAGLIATLVAAIGVVTWIGWLLWVTAMTRWFDTDLRSRAALAAYSSRNALAEADSLPSRLTPILAELVRDGRVRGAAVCSRDGQTEIAATPDLPPTVSCRLINARMAIESADRLEQPWSTTIGTLDALHVTAVSAGPGAPKLSFIIITQDRRELAVRLAEVRRLLILGFSVLAVLASGVILVAGRDIHRGWSESLRRSIEDGIDRPEFRFVTRHIRALADRLAAEHDVNRDIETWTPRRLREALTRHLQGEELIIVANREPYIHDRSETGEIRVRHPASGLVTALEPVLRACSGVWIAHGSGSADRETVDDRDHIRVPPDDEMYTLRRVWLTPEEERGYYYGYANEGLWPLCHLVDARPVFRNEDWRYYVDINQRFADAVVKETATDSPVVLVQDYHFALAPKFIRERLPKATILSFWHIPWPNAERLGICPHREELLEGMLGSDILGFHTRFYCNNFVEAVDRYLEARIDRDVSAIIQLGHRTHVQEYPISIEWPPRRTFDRASAADARLALLKELDLPSDALLGVGVDRLDYTKGIEERLLAVERLLERYPEFIGRFRFVQIAAPSRTAIDRYRLLGESVVAIAERINGRFGTPAYQPIILRAEHHEPDVVYRYYRAAHVCYVSSLHDGMNLVAKEFVAARSDEDGVLVLSRFTGASSEMTEALVVNPYDLDDASDALATALRMDREERRVRMHRMRTHLAEYNVYRWAGRMLLDAARLRRRADLNSRLKTAASIA